jgi:chlorobactene glucosyltransferase
MLYQLIIAGGLVLFMINLFLNLRSLKRPRPDSRPPVPAPLISVMVPARDEEDNIESCLGSLQAQDYPNFEILVIDDHSSDNTAAIVKRMAAQDSRIRFFQSEPLPEGWAGKTFACYQLARQARGSWFLFVDADTIHAPHMLRSVLTVAMESNRLGMLSGFPRQLANSLPQKIAIPVLYFVIMSWLPIWWLHRSRRSRPSLAIGQFLLFPREDYWKIGGHQAVKSRIIEDVWLGVEINRSGSRHIAIDLSPVVSCNMYHDVGAMCEGFIKWMYSVAAMSRIFLALLLAAGYAFYLAPFYWLWRELFVMPTGWGAIIGFQVLVIFGMRWLVDSRFKEPVVSFILHPLGFSFLILTVLYAGSRQVVGAGVRWKNRLYSKESAIE